MKSEELKNKLGAELIDPEIETVVVHSQTKSAWNIVGKTLGGKHKIARVPYLCIGDEYADDRSRIEALEHAKFISYCFNNSDDILTTYGQINHNPNDKTNL